MFSKSSKARGSESHSAQVSCLPRLSVRACSTQAKHTFSHAGPSKAAAMIIGNEILSGSITDTNTPWLAQLLYK